MGLRATRYVLKWEFQEPPNVRGAGGLYAPRIDEGARAEFHPAPLRCAHVRGISREVFPLVLREFRAELRAVGYTCSAGRWSVHTGDCEGLSLFRVVAQQPQVPNWVVTRFSS